MLERARVLDFPPTLRRPSFLLPMEARGLVFTARGRRLVDGLDLTLAGSGLTVIMGPNGAGKSLTLRLLHGLLAPEAGTVRWAGRPADAAIRRRQAMVFQRPVLLRRSAAANLDYVLQLRGLSGAVRRDRVRELLEHGSLAHLAASPARSLSGGEQQRLALVRALALEPEILFLDEPTASLDPASTHAIEGLIADACRQGCKIVLVTHDLGQARRLADEVAFIAHGKVLEHRPASAFFANPRSAAAADFLAGRLVL